MKKFSFATENISTLCLSLAHLFHAGVGIADALFLLYEDEEDPACKQLLRGMAKYADEGHPLAACFQAAGVFPHYLCALLSVGEGVGKTEQTLLRLGTYYQSMARLQRQLRRLIPLFRRSRRLSQRERRLRRQRILHLQMQFVTNC